LQAGSTSGAEASWALEHPPWLDGVPTWGPWILAVLFVVLLVRAALHAKRYRADGVLGDEAREAVRKAIADVEARTNGEVVVVVVERSDRHPAACWLSALTALVIGTVLLEGILPRDALWLVLLQVLLGAVGYGVANALPAWKRMFVRESRASEMAEEQATQEFFQNGVYRTVGHTGVLVFVSLFERRVVLLGDEGINAKTGPEHWVSTDETILRRARDGSLADGLVEGIRLLGDALAEHFPPLPGQENELADHLIVRAE
jgi:putative membrane protein